MRRRSLRAAGRDVKVLPLFLFIALISGCASGPKKPAFAASVPPGTPAVTIRSSENFPGVSIYVTKVDGLPVRYRERFMDPGTSAPVKVAAGFHEVEVTVNGGQVVHRWTFGYDFREGHTYRVNYAGPFDMRVRLHDETAGTSRVIEGPKKL